MFKLIKLITLRSGAGEAERAAVVEGLQAATRDDQNVARARVAQTGAYVVNGGDLHWHVQFRDENGYKAWVRDGAGRGVDALLSRDPVAHVDTALYEQELTSVQEPGIRNGIHRTLLLAVRPMMSLDKIAQFEGEMREMARYVPAIRNWSFSRVAQASGTRGWTHVWEQEFQDEGGLMGPYMMHPIHFASIDRWFDSQSHDWIVENELCHSYCGFTDSMIAPLKD